MNSKKMTPGFDPGDLNEVQQQIVQHRENAALVIAGAGSGKTRVIVHRVVELIRSGVRPSSIMMLTFTNKAAREMAERVTQTLPQTRSQEKIVHGTFHSIASRFLRRHSKLLNYENNFTILDSSDSVDLIRAAIADVVGKTDKQFPKAGLLNTIFSLAFNKNCSITELYQRTYLQRQFDLDQLINLEYDYLAEHTEKIIKIHEVFRQKKIRNRAMGFDDLLENWLVLLLRHKPSLKMVDEIEYLLVDEYQDTNRVQADILNELTQKHQNIMVVGDDAQSIYSWRGANFKNILEFPNRYNATTYRLEQNYRSTPDILELANASINKNTEQFEKELYSTHPNLEKPTLYHVYDPNEEALLVVDEIQDLRDQDLELNQMSVLYRNHIQSARLQIALTEAGIPFIIHSGVKFFEQAHIKDVLSFLKVVFNPLDEISWMRLLKMIPGVGNVTAQKIFQVFVQQQAVRLNTSNEALQQNIPAKARPEWDKLLTVFKAMLGDKKTPSEMIRIVYNQFYKEFMLTAYDDASTRQADITYLEEFSSKFKTIDKLLNDLSLSGSAVIKEKEEDDRKEEEFLTLTTIHQAKGLEWDVVFVIGLTDEQFPHKRCITPKSRLEEERRLFYVAVTRAKKHLYLTAPLVSNAYGQIIQTGRSRFIYEVPEELFEHVHSENTESSYESYGVSSQFYF